MEQLLALLGFAFVTAFTPGPNNMMVMISGANWGFARSLPHIFGIALGFPLMVLAVGLGLGQFFEAYPLAHDIMKYLAAAYLLFLAWKLATAGRHDASGARTGRPMTFLQAALFQWVNPKAWIMSVGALVLFSGTLLSGIASSLIVAGAFLLAAFPSTAVWCLFGTGIARFLGTDRRTAIFNISMAALLILSMIPTLL